jgi:hypothetical protein
VYRFAGGAPLYVSTWSAFGGESSATAVDQAALDNAGAGSVWNHANYRPADGTFVHGSQTGQVYRLVGGAPLYVSTWSAYGGAQPTIAVDQAALDNASAGSVWNHVAYQPADGTFVHGSQTGQVYRFAGGAPVYVSTWSAFGGQHPTIAVDQAALDNAGAGSIWNHLNYRPVDGTFVHGAQTGAAYQILNGHPNLITDWSTVGGLHPTIAIDQVAINNAGAGSVWNHLI